MAEAQNKMTIPILLAVMAGGGTAGMLPKVAPEWYRPDPAHGTELREVRDKVGELSNEFLEFRREDPARAVLATQERIIDRLDRIIMQIDAYKSHSH